MRDSHQPTPWPIVAAAVSAGVFAVVFGLYVWGYFAFSIRHDLSNFDGSVVRTFAASWQARIYHPAANVEGLLIGREVSAVFDPDSPLPFER